MIEVNGVEHRIDDRGDTPLLDVLRNDLGLAGTRFGCGLGMCGACHVLVDGEAVTSCDLPVWAVEGKAVTTVEAIGRGDELPGLAAAFIEEQAAQCAYCVSGILVSAAALLHRLPYPGDDDVRAALERNLCRCGAHGRMVRAVLRAAADVQVRSRR
ncbi:MAG: (2Fe-2S)-binding protein [Acidimicrobiales bacterium]